MAKKKRYSKTVRISIPEPIDGDDPITQNQMRYIERLAPDLKIASGIENLTKWQASDIIDQIKKLQVEVDEEAIEQSERSAPKKSNAGWWGLGLIFLAVILSDQCSS